MYDHPVIQDIEKKLKTIDAIQDDAKRFAAFADLRLHVAREKTALFGRLNDQQQDDPSRLDADKINRYHELEIAEAYLSVSDYANSTAKNAIKNVIGWKSPTGQPTAAAQFKLAHDNATAPKAEPREKFTVSVSHNRL